MKHLNKIALTIFLSFFAFAIYKGLKPTGTCKGCYFDWSNQTNVAVIVGLLISMMVWILWPSKPKE